MKIPCMVCEYLNVYILIHNIYTIHMRYYWIRYGICVAVLAAYSSNENSRSCVFATFYHSPWPISCIQYWKERLAHPGSTAPNRVSFFYFFFSVFILCWLDVVACKWRAFVHRGRSHMHRTLLQQTWMADCVSVSSFVAYLGFLARYWHVGLTAFDSPMSLRPNHVERICYRSVGWLGGRVLGLATVATGHHHDDACFIGQRNFIYACCSINTIQGSQCNKMHFCCVCVWECKCNTHTGLHILHIHYIEDEWSAV